MARIDDNFISMCRDILENGTTTEGQKVRPHWEDGTPAYTIKKFGVVTRYNLGEEFPILTLRKTPAKSAFDEILWIYQEKSNNVHDLHSDIWNAWADEKGTIGRAYGYQMAVKHLYRDITRKGIEKAFGDVPIPEIATLQSFTRTNSGIPVPSMTAQKRPSTWTRWIGYCMTL